MRSTRTTPIVLLAALLLGGVLGAQGGIAVTRLDVELWPEYDRPAMLVIQRLRLAPGVSLPAELSLRIPATAGDPNAVAERLADGQLVNVSYGREVEGEWSVLRFTASRPELQVEYYDPTLRTEETRRTYTYRWPGDVPAGEVVVSVQQPLGATDLRTEPAAAGRSSGQRGLVYHTVSLGGRGAGEAAEVRVEYEKDSDALTAEAMPATGTASGSKRESGSGSGASGSGTAAEGNGGVGQGGIPGTGGDAPLWPWIVGGLALGLLAGGILIRWRYASRAKAGSRSGGPGEPRPRRVAEADGGEGAADAGRAEAGAAGAIEGEEADRFCTRCGAPARAADRFCHRCGQRLKEGD